MDRNVFWVPAHESGLEHLRLRANERGHVADGVVIAMDNGQPFRVWYEIQVDQLWRVKDCAVRLLDEEHQGITLQADGAGHWSDATGGLLPALDGCLDVDLTATPFTNTLPIRRLELAPGEAAELLIAYIMVPAMEVRSVRQRYTCLERCADGGIYRYESLSSGFKRDLVVDEDGLVLDYPDIWKRVDRSV